MRPAAPARPALLLIAVLGLTGCFADEPPDTVETDIPAVQLKVGAGQDVSVWVDGRALENGDPFSWTVDHKDVVSVELMQDATGVHVTATGPGHATLTLGYKTTAVLVPVEIAP